MSTETTIQRAAIPPLSSSDLFCFRWWYKGRTTDGNTIKLSGHVRADNETGACCIVEAEMRKEHPTIRWMQGRETEGNGIWFGPTVQKLKGRKQNVPAHRPGK